MDGFDRSVRDANGRFVPGQSGNPAGKRPGTKNRATLMAEALAEGEAEAVLRLVVEKALAGDSVAARFLLGRIFAKPRGRTIRLALPKGARPGDVVAAFNATLAAMAAGEITPEEALIVTRVLDGRRRALEAFALRKKLTRYGERIPGDEVSMAAAEEAEERENSLPPSPQNPLPHAGEGRVRADADASDGAAVAPIPSPRPSPVNGRGSNPDRGESTGGARLGAGEPLHFACKAPAASRIGASSLRRHLAAGAAALPLAPC